MQKWPPWDFLLMTTKLGTVPGNPSLVIYLSPADRDILAEVHSALKRISIIFNNMHKTSGPSRIKTFFFSIDKYKTISSQI